MYKPVKKLIRLLLPQKLLFRIEPALRSVLFVFYRGNRFQCNMCGKHLLKFIQLEDGDRLCPYCGSISRTRRLYELIEKDFLYSGIKILDFSPSRSLFRLLKSRREMFYDSTDIGANFLSDYHYDITELDVSDEMYDLVICYHVLEHVIEDSKAIKELYRVTKTGGHCIIQAPFKEGEIYEDLAINTDTLRLKYFGQKDHVRIYSVSGLCERLKSAGFQVSAIIFDELPENKHGFNLHETIILCTR